MTEEKKQFIKNYIDILTKAIDSYNNAAPDAIDHSEDDLFDVIIEVCNVFLQELPQIKDVVLLRSGTGIRDANSVLGILNLYLVNNAQHTTANVTNDDASKIFISHRSVDKKIVDILEGFLTSCGIPFDKIFCSSLPGINVEEKISSEVKYNLQRSVLNIVILSSDYYQSPYCQNEAGIIWFLETEKIVIALPEIDENLMEGFLNDEHIIRRLNSKNDLTAICNNKKKHFPCFISSNAKINANIDRLIEQYNNEIQKRTVNITSTPNPFNIIENRILSREFSDVELMVLYYFYENQVTMLSDDLLKINNWLNQKGINVSISDALDTLTADSIIEYKREEFEENSFFILDISTYRELRKISQNTLDVFKQICAQKSDENASNDIGNPIDELILKGFSEPEILLIHYINELKRNNLFAGWQAVQEVQMIKNWEEINQLNTTLSTHYTNVLSKFEIRKYIVPSAKTSYGNTKEYKIKDEFLKFIGSLNQSSKNKIQSVLEKNHIDELDLPF